VRRRDAETPDLDALSKLGESLDLAGDSHSRRNPQLR